MRKLIFPAVLITAFLLSCGNETIKETADSAGGNKKGMSVGDPLGDNPVVVNDSIFNGPFIDRYANGVIYMSGEISGGLRTGEWLTFYKSGKEWSRGIYKNGFREGYGVSYWENGQKSSEGNYKKDKKVGKWKFWNEQGQMVEKDFGGDK